MSGNGEACDTCVVNPNATLKRLGEQVGENSLLVALAGNPNTGKSTVFNALTGLKQHTGNWPGKTVARAEGGYTYNERNYKLVDLPGTYSLLSTSVDEEVARDFLLFGKPDVTIVVVDATRLERNLNLLLQVLEITDKVVCALNLIDEAERHGIKIDVRSLSRDLGIPVVPIVARVAQGIKELLGYTEQVALGVYKTSPRRVASLPKDVSKTLDAIAAQVETLFPGIANARWVAMRLLEGDQSIIDALKRGILQ